MKETIENLLSRKFLLSAGVLALAGVAMFMKIATVDQFVEIAKWIVGLFIAGNVVGSVGGDIAGKISK